MCIPIIYISCVKILRMYSVKNSLMLMVICCFHILVASAGQQHCFLTARGTEKKGRRSDLPGATGVSRRSGSRGNRAAKHLLEISHDCKATVDGRRSLELKPHMGTFVHISHGFFFLLLMFALMTKCLFMLVHVNAQDSNANQGGKRRSNSAPSTFKSPSEYWSHYFRLSAAF